jgi:hypothetical protein
LLVSNFLASYAKPNFDGGCAKASNGPSMGSDHLFSSTFS